jgi:hypothetical protein
MGNLPPWEDVRCQRNVFTVRGNGTRTTVIERDGMMLARLESDDRVFEVALNSTEPTDVTLRFISRAGLSRFRTRVGWWG